MLWMCFALAGLNTRGDGRFDLFATALCQTIAESRLPPRTGALTFDLRVFDFRDDNDPLAVALRWMAPEAGRSQSRGLLRVSAAELHGACAQ